MAFSKVGQMAAAALLLVFLAGVAMQVVAGVDEKACLSPIVTLTPCLPYIQGNTSAPTGACCRNLAQVVQDQPMCLCAVLDGKAGQWLGIPIDVDRALALPPACNVQTPPTSNCNDVSKSPSPSPALSPSISSGLYSAASFTKSSLSLSLGLLFAALYSVNFRCCPLFHVA